MAKRKPAAKTTTSKPASGSAAQPKFGSPAWQAKYAKRTSKKRGSKKTGS